MSGHLTSSEKMSMEKTMKIKKCKKMPLSLASTASCPYELRPQPSGSNFWSLVMHTLHSTGKERRKSSTWGTKHSKQHAQSSAGKERKKSSTWGTQQHAKSSAGKERRKSSLGHIACKELCWEGKKKEQLGAHSIQSSMHSSCNKNKAAATLDSKKKSQLKRPKT